MTGFSMSNFNSTCAEIFNTIREINKSLARQDIQQGLVPWVDEFTGEPTEEGLKNGLSLDTVVPHGDTHKSTDHDVANVFVDFVAQHGSVDACPSDPIRLESPEFEPKGVEFAEKETVVEMSVACNGMNFDVEETSDSILCPSQISNMSVAGKKGEKGSDIHICAFKCLLSSCLQPVCENVKTSLPVFLPTTWNLFTSECGFFCFKKVKFKYFEPGEPPPLPLDITTIDRVFPVLQPKKMAFVGNWCYIQPLVIAAIPPAKPPEDGCSKSFDCIKLDSSAILDIKSLNWASIVGVIVHYDSLVVRLKLMGKLENRTIFLKKRHDDAEGLLKFKTDSNLNILRKVGCVDNGNMMYELLAAGHFSESYNGLYRNVKLDCSATGIQFMDKEISAWVLHKLVVNAFKFLTTWVLSADHVACLRNLAAEYSTFLVKSDSNTAVKSAPASMKWAAVVVKEEHDDKFDLLTVIVEDSMDDDFNSDINHDTTLDESLVVGVTVRKVTSNIFLADFSSGLVLNHAEIREWRFETQFYALTGTLRSLLPTVCENVKMSLLSLLVGVTNLIKSWCSVFMKPPAQPPYKSLNILHGLESFVNFKLMGVQYKHDILYDLHGGRITMTVSIRGVKFGKISAPYVYERKLVYIIAYCNLYVSDIVPFSLTPKLSYELGLEQTLNFLHKVVKHVIVGGSKLQFVKACDAFVEWENICGYLAAAMSASKGSIPKHFDIIGTNWVAISTAFCGEIVDLDLGDQASSDLAETNSDMKLNDLPQYVEPHVCLMHHTQFDSFTILNIESFNKAFSDEYSAAPSILEVIMVFDSHPELRQERLSHEVFQWGIGGMERLSDANADTISLPWEDLKQVLYGGQENMVQKFHPAVKALTDNTDIRLNHTVTKIYYGSDKVMATVEEGRILVAHTLIITTPLGFLKAYFSEFERNLLEWKIAAISGGVGNEQCVSLKTVDMFCPNEKFLGVVVSTLNGYLKYLYKGMGQPILVYMGVEGSAPPTQARIDSHNKVIFKRKFAWNLLASVFTWRRKFLMFSLPRPPEVNDLEDKVQFKGDGMIRAYMGMGLLLVLDKWAEII